MSEPIYRPPKPEDAEACGRIVYEAFRCISAQHNFPPDFPSPEAAMGMARAVCGNPKFFGVVAEADGRLVGSNFLDERDTFAAVGPITVDPAYHGRGVGRRLMQAVIDRARERGAPGVRLVQDAFNRTSMSLYTALGFDVKEPLAFMHGAPTSRPTPGTEARPMRDEDLDACAAICRSVHGFDRTNELRDAVRHARPFVLVRGGRVRAYASATNFPLLSHGVAETEQDLRDLLTGVPPATGEPTGLLLPTRQSSLFCWALAAGLRIVKPMTLMAMGEYREPRGCWFPSVAY
jgi:predicted N-acetyltransferase YhbS